MNPELKKIKPGDIFSDWVVIKKDTVKNFITYWLCKCSCGATKAVAAPSLVCGQSKRCLMCYLKKRAIPVEGGSSNPVYSVWIGMIRRCEDKCSQNYMYYGAKGVSVSKEWHVFMTFYKDMGERPSVKHSIDRIDNSKGYCKENCRWVTIEIQANNKTNNRFILYKNKKQTLSQWARFLNIRVDTLHGYLKRNKFEKAYKHFKGE